jgi:hypothetical protein
MENVVLPVNWLAVSGKRRGHDNQVQWSTASETKNAVFEVQASPNGIQFTTIGKRAGVGNPAGTNHYNFLHTGVTAPLTYYRIKQTDPDGRATYSITVKVAATSLQPMLTVSNPVYSKAIVSFTTAIPTSMQLTLTDPTGHTIEIRKVSVGIGVNTIAINMDGRAAGVYFLQAVDEEGNKYVKQLVKY